MRALDISSAIEEFAPSLYQERWDNSGYCIGSPEQEVKGVLIALDCTLSIVKEAIESGCDMIITHHPLIFDGVRSISPDNTLGEIIITAIKYNIVIYSAHTSIDKVFEGVSWQMALRMGMKEIKILEPDAGRMVRDHEIGLGIIGELIDPLPPDLLIGKVKEVFGLKCVKTSPLPAKIIRRVAMCGGSGKSLIALAKAEGADLYISGDIPYHEFFCEEGFMIMDIGHYESEIDIVNTLYSIVTKKISNFAVRITKNNNNPVQYY